MIPRSITPLFSSSCTYRQSIYRYLVPHPLPFILIITISAILTIMFTSVFPATSPSFHEKRFRMDLSETWLGTYPVFCFSFHFLLLQASTRALCFCSRVIVVTNAINAPHDHLLTSYNTFNRSLLYATKSRHKPPSPPFTFRLLYSGLKVPGKLQSTTVNYLSYSNFRRGTADRT